MSQKSLIWLGMVVGTTIGGCIPMLWGDNFFSLTSVILTAVGGFFGIYIALRLSNS